MFSKYDSPKNSSTLISTDALDNSDTFLTPPLLEKISHKLSEQQHKPGMYLVATPIGNMFDITFRAIEILRRAELIFAEDTRQSKKLLSFYDIQTPLVSCHEYNETDSVAMIRSDKIYALVSDAGTPTMSDPGYRMVNWCLQNGVNVSPIPGACSFVAGMSVAGLPTDSFSFYGFLPTKLQALETFFREISERKETLIFLESPKRLQHSLVVAEKILGNRKVCVCREITKIFEHFHRGKVSELVEYFYQNEPRGECVIIIEGNLAEKTNYNETQIMEKLKIEMEKNSLKDAVKKISEEYGVSKNIIYAHALNVKENL